MGGAVIDILESDVLRHTLAPFGRSLIGLVLVLAIIGKIRGPKRLVVLISDYGVPPAFAIWVARFLLPCEGLLATLLLLDVATVWVSLAAALLFMMFGGVIAWNLVGSRLAVSCGCFGSAAGRLHWGHVARNLVLACTALLSVAVTWPEPQGHAVPAETLLVMHLCALMFLICARLALLCVRLVRGAVGLTEPAIALGSQRAEMEGERA